MKYTPQNIYRFADLERPWKYGIGWYILAVGTEGEIWTGHL
jgi:hypothetical protein